MANHTELEILDIEEKTDSFRVVFEVPGEPYGQDYPKRLSHSFPLKDSYFKELPNGQKRFEKILAKNYCKTCEEEKEQEEKARSQIKDMKKQFKGKKLSGDQINEK